MTSATAAGSRARVLIVDDEKEIHADFESILGRQVGSESDDLAAAFVAEERVELDLDFELQHAMNGEEAYELIAAGRRRDEPIAVAYVDVRMPPGIDGVEAVRRIRTIDRDIEIVIMTAYADKSLPEIVNDMELLHKLLYIRKPFSREEVQQFTLALTKKWRVERELAASRQQLEAVLDATGEAIALYREPQRLLYANRGYEQIMGAGRSELQAMSPHALADALRGALPAAGFRRGAGIRGRARGWRRRPGGARCAGCGRASSVPPITETVAQRAGRGDRQPVRVPRRVHGHRDRADADGSDAVAFGGRDHLLVRAHRRLQSIDAADVRPDAARAGRRPHDPHHRGERHRQGTGGQGAALRRRPQGTSVRGRQLLRHPAGAHRERAVRT